MMNQTSSNFQNLTGTICCLSHGDNASKNSTFQEGSPSNKSQQSFQKNNLSDGFSGLQQNLGQQYSLDSQDSMKLISLLVSVLEEIMANVATNSDSSTSPTEETKTTSNAATLSTTDSADSDNTMAEVSADSCPYS